ncbi:MAG: site-2 protease family protein, partial [Dehalococcoidia bacterium]|nr:site-2 protease family protein [Dehalococcoidia bacterium]
NVVVGKVVIGEVQANSPAEAAGVQAGDIILSADGHTLDNHADLGFRIRLSLGEEMTWVVQRDRQERIIALMPRLNPPEGQGAAGVTVSTEDSRVESRSQPPWTAIGSGMHSVVDVVVITKNEFTKWLAGGRTPQVAGPIGMGQVFSEVAQQSGFQLKERISLIINLAAIISLSLAVFNILPIPALDGGRLPFLLIELVRRGKRVPPRLEGLVHLVGFAVLITLAILIGTVDIIRISNGQSLLGG